MREIKFRVWDGIRITTSGIMFNTSLGIVEVPEGSQMKLMQFTGLLDKNGKEIYEGDIVKGERDYKHVIEWEDKESRFIAVSWSIRCGIPQEWIVRYNKQVIGNIYENPELLK